MVSSKLILKCKSVQFISDTNRLKNKEFELKINTDSRSFKPNETFVALVGDNFDGFRYLENVLELKANTVVFTTSPERENLAAMLALYYPKILFIGVTDALIFLQELAKFHLVSWKKQNTNKKIIGITGSNGKTTHKEMVAYLLNSILPNKVLATQGNLNNHIGVPLTIFRLTKKHEVAIIEMGMNHSGEIQALCDIALPEHGMITNIGAAHIEFLKSMENIYIEKSTLYRAVLKNQKGKGIFVVNHDDPYLARLEKSKGLTTFGEKSGDVKVLIDEQNISFTFNKQNVWITNKNILEHHNLKNLAGTALFCMNLYPKFTKKIIDAACNYEQPSMNRSEWIENIFLDAYNANPSSMRVSLDSFVSVMKTKKVNLDNCYFVLGDMNELGDFSREMHREIAQHAKEIGIKNISFIGRFKEFYCEGFVNPTSSYLTKNEFTDEWKKIRREYEYIFVKASRSLQLETLMTIL